MFFGLGTIFPRSKVAQSYISVGNTTFVAIKFHLNLLVLQSNILGSKIPFPNTAAVVCFDSSFFFLVAQYLKTFSHFLRPRLQPFSRFVSPKKWWSETCERKAAFRKSGHGSRMHLTKKVSKPLVGLKVNRNFIYNVVHYHLSLILCETPCKSTKPSIIKSDGPRSQKPTAAVRRTPALMKS